MWKRINKICKLKDDSSMWVSNIVDICRVARKYFKNIFAPSTGYLWAQMHPDKALGPDEFNPASFKTFGLLQGITSFDKGFPVCKRVRSLTSYFLNAMTLVP